MSFSTRRFERKDGPGGRRFTRNELGGDNGGRGEAVAVANVPTLVVLDALERLDPPSRALLDLSIRLEIDHEQIAAIGRTDVGLLNETRDEAVRLVTAGIDVPPAEELAHVRRALSLLYASTQVTEVEAPPASRPVEERVDLDELESLLELEVAPEPQPRPAPEPEAPARRRGRPDVLLLGILVLAAFLRVWQLNKLGLNSDEAVYAGQGAAIANDPVLTPFFPAFRAHPLLFQTALSIGDHLGFLATFGRLLSAAIGVATVALTYGIGNLLYGRRAALVGALFLALMPYHVVVTRQILLDGPMVLFATLSLYLVARFAVTRRPEWLYAAGAAMGLTAMSKETSLVLLGAIYAFLALTPQLKVTLRQLLGSVFAMGAVLILFPLSLSLAGKTETSGNYLAWQLFRRPNHDWLFYPTQVPKALGLGLVLAAIAGLVVLRRRGSWRETLLLAWIAVPVVFFQLWPVKGFQYLLPIAPAVALLAARTIAHWGAGRPSGVRTLLTDRRVAIAAAAAISLSLLIGSVGRIDQAGSATFLAGSGGVPGGREGGTWIDTHVPKGAQILTVGPSMANIIEFYGHRKAFGLSVSPNPLNRNPSYQPIGNPDQSIRSNELQYLVWDAYSASRSKFFSRSLLRYADRYHGRVVHTETVAAKTGDGKHARVPVLRVYEVRP
jgi:hypothetical protein